MIIIIGSMIDDILYFISKLKNKKEIIIFGKYKVYTGTILNRPVALISDIHTDYLTSALTAHLIEKFHALMIFVIGKTNSYSKDVKKGTIAISRQIYLGDVNQIGIDKVQLGQIPTLPSFFLCDPYVASIVKNGALRIAPNNFTMCPFVSTNTFNKTMEDISSFTDTNTVFGHKGPVMIDNETGGVAVAAELYDIPFISIKVVEASVGERLTEEHMFDAYKNYPLIGKIVTYCIGEIGRNDMLSDLDE